MVAYTIHIGKSSAGKYARCCVAAVSQLKHLFKWLWLGERGILEPLADLGLLKTRRTKKTTKQKIADQLHKYQKLTPDNFEPTHSVVAYKAPPSVPARPDCYRRQSTLFVSSRTTVWRCPVRSISASSQTCSSFVPASSASPTAKQPRWMAYEDRRQTTLKWLDGRLLAPV